MPDIPRWEVSAKRNSPLFLNFSREIRSLGLEQLSISDPETAKEVRRNRMHLYILGAGLLDVARYRNLMDKGESSAHLIESWLPAIDSELSDYITLNHEQEFNDFRFKWAEETNDFDFMDMYKTGLYFAMFRLEQTADEWNPVTLLEKSLTVHRWLLINKPELFQW